MLKEVVDKILHAQLGDEFPESGVGKQWTQQFVEQHSNQLKTFWSLKLDSKQGQGVNPNANAKWFSLLDDVLAGKMDHEFDSCEDVVGGGEDEIDWESIPMHEVPTNTEGQGQESAPMDTDVPSHAKTHQSPYTPIDPECIYSANESGFMENDGIKIHIIGSSSKKMQHKQGGGSRENTTVIVTICADGTALTPTVIFKGTHFKVNWDQENPTNAS
ncbi:hypothetical protein AAF712_014488 [Marasmius tenuissimus]|uniref:HTH CENPB-type domain-containing protein n=1 Tax=Marasmius tenuissimus TaxID=585030 RepID=A0ABR2ZC18_9AGAR